MKQEELRNRQKGGKGGFGIKDTEEIHKKKKKTELRRLWFHKEEEPRSESELTERESILCSDNNQL